MACENNEIEIVKLLKNRKDFDISALDRNGESGLDIAKVNDFKDIIDLLSNSWIKKWILTWIWKYFKIKKLHEVSLNAKTSQYSLFFRHFKSIKFYYLPIMALLKNI